MSILRGRTLRSTAVLLLGALSRGGAQGIAALLVANSIGAGEWGLVATVQVAVLLVVQLTSSGSYVAQLGKSDGPDRMQTALAPSRIELLTLSIVTSAAGLLLATLFLDLNRNQIILSAAMASAMALGGNLEQITKADLVMQSALGKVAALNASRSLVLLGVAIGFVAAGGPGGATGWLACIGLAWSLHVTVVGFIRLRLRLPALSRRRNGVLSNLTALGSFGIGVAATAALRTSDQMLVADMASLEDAGSYAVAARLVDVGVLVMGAQAQVYHRFLAEQTTAGDLAVAARSIGRKLAATGLVLMIGVMAGSVVLERLLDESFTDVAEMGIILAISLLARGAFLAYVFALMLAGRTLDRTVAIIAALALNIVLNIVFIPRWGGTGAAASTVVCESVLVLMLAAQLSRLRSSGAAIKPATALPAN